MDIKNKLRNTLVKRIQQLSTDKLIELNNMLNKLDQRTESKESTLAFAGSWKDLDDDILKDLATDLHNNRANDREII